MSPVLFLQIATIVSDLIIFVFVGFYLWRLTKDRKRLDEKEKQLAQNEAKLTSQYEQIIENAHQKEREILDNAAKKAEQILQDVNITAGTVQKSVEQSLQQMVFNIKNQATNASDNYLDRYKKGLGVVSDQSLSNFQKITGRFEVEMEKQLQDFRNKQLENIKRDLEEYKQKRLANADKKINEMINKVSRKVFKKSISLEEHKELIIRSLERSKKEGVFD